MTRELQSNVRGAALLFREGFLPPVSPLKSPPDMPQHQPQRMSLRARGVLALIASGDDAVALPYYPYQSSVFSEASSIHVASAAIHRARGRRRRRERQRQRPEGSGVGDVEVGDAVVGSHADHAVRQSTPYDHEASEFTLLYFADSTCRNCLRFNPILARFLHSANRSHCNGGGDGVDGGGEGAGVAADHLYCQDGMERTATSANASTTASNSRDGDQTARKIVQCICVPNDTTEKGADSICQGLGTHCLPFHHKNRLALIRLLSVQRVPTVVVLNGATGQKVTPLGMEGIERAMAMTAGDDPAVPIDNLIDAWRVGGSGVGWTDQCLIS